MLKVVQFIHGFNMGGAETLVKDYALCFDRKKVDLTVLCYEHYNSPYEKILEDAGVKVIYVCDKMLFGKRNDFWARLINKIQRYVLIKRILRDIDADIIHFHLQLNNYIKFARPKKETILFYTQHFEASRLKNEFAYDMRNIKWMMRHYNMYLIALNDSMKRELEELFETEQVLVINNGVDVDKFQKNVDVERMREKIGIPKDAFVIGHVGRFSKVKNHDFLVNVFAEYYKRNTKAFLLMVGKGDTMEEVQRKIIGLGLGDKTLILSDRTDIAELMKVMNVLVFPSFSEGMPVTLVEAQVSGIRCLVADTISDEIKVSNLLKYKNLSDSSESWALEIENWNDMEPQFYNIDKWDMIQIVKDLEKIYYDKYEKYSHGWRKK